MMMGGDLPTASSASVDVSLADVCAFLEQGLDEVDDDLLPPGKRLRLDFEVGAAGETQSGSASSSTQPSCAGNVEPYQPRLLPMPGSYGGGLSMGLGYLGGLGQQLTPEEAMAAAAVAERRRALFAYGAMGGMLPMMAAGPGPALPPIRSHSEPPRRRAPLKSPAKQKASGRGRGRGRGRGTELTAMSGEGERGDPHADTAFPPPGLPNDGLGGDTGPDGKNSKSHACSWPNCGKSFSSRWGLDRHYRIHTGEKPWVCTFDNCGKGFVDRALLARHEKTHSKDRPHVCHHPGCDKAFKVAKHLEYHMTLHEQPDAFCCGIEGCRKNFSNPSSLRIHRLLDHESPESETAIEKV